MRILASEIVEAVKAHSGLKVLILEGNTMGVEAASLIGEALAGHKEFQVRCKYCSRDETEGLSS